MWKKSPHPIFEQRIIMQNCVVIIRRERVSAQEKMRFPAKNSAKAALCRKRREACIMKGIEFPREAEKRGEPTCAGG
jgi:hypothetical protein